MAPKNSGGSMQEIKASVSELARRAGISPERAFAAWYAINVFDLDEDAALEAASLDQSEDNGVDFLHVDHPSERIILLQGHFPKNSVKAAPKSKFDGLLTAIAMIEDPSSFESAGRPDIASVAKEVLEHKESYQFLIGLVSSGSHSSQIQRTIEATRKSPRYNDYEFFYEADEAIREKWSVGDDNVGADSISFESAKGWFEDKGEYGRAIVGSVNATELNRLYEKHKERLFARNVRLFLGTRKGGINEQIITTAKEAAGQFWALNNGITFVADTIEPTDTKGTFDLRRFSIVNGCQTTVSLCRAGAPKGAKVLARIVAANQMVVNDIVRFNNTQNAIRIWTVRAADPIHERMREAFHNIGISYAPKPTGSRRSKDGVIELDRLAQFLASFDEKVIDAVREKSELFDRHYQAIFPHHLTATEVYLAWLLGTMADSARQERLQALKEQADADRVQTGLLGVAGTYWTVHCASKVVFALNPKPVRWELDALRVDTVQHALRKYVLEGMEVFLELAIDTYDQEEYTSVRQALRSPRFLEKLDRKLANRVARIKSAKGRLPSLDGAAKSAGGKGRK